MADSATSDCLFSDEEPARIQADASSRDVLIPSTQRNDSHSTESTSSANPSRPLVLVGTRKRMFSGNRAMDTTTDSESSDVDDGRLTDDRCGRGGIREIKNMLQLLFEKVEKNDRALTKLQNNMQPARFVYNKYYYSQRHVRIL